MLLLMHKSTPHSMTVVTGTAGVDEWNINEWLQRNMLC